MASVAVVLLVAVLAPIAAAIVGHIAKVPLVVFEIVLGMIVGPSVLGWVAADHVLDELSTVGLVMLFFMAGHEINFTQIKGRAMKRAALGWAVSLVAGVAVGIVLARGSIDGVYIGIALSSTALGTIMPMLRDAGHLRTPFGRSVIAVGAAGEFLPLLAISLFLSGRQPMVAALILIVFVIVSGLAIWFALHQRNHHLNALVNASLHTSGQFAVRLVLLIVVSLVALSLVLGLDLLIGAFAAGILARIVLQHSTEADKVTIERKLEAISFGFLVPAFFIVAGATFDFDSLVADPQSLILVPVFLVLLLVVRGIPGAFAAPQDASWSQRNSLALFSATGLPIIIAVTGIALDQHAMAPGVAAALVGAGMLSVLIFPLLALMGTHALAEHSADTRESLLPKDDSAGVF
ncbi:MAG: cation:proton antiporter [Microbacteriaceae bacterium]